jgi:hemerythrin
MPHFIWYNTYSIHHDEIDEQHKKLFDIFNRLYNICIGDDVIHSFKSVLDDLVSYSDYHFKTEEQYMRIMHYKDINKQITEHEYFTKKVLELKNDDNNEDYEQCHELMIFLGDWLLNHVMKEDKKITG